ncbi:hypothetical protein HELRODRAFT_189016 [Helobdella robusta]|uniref:Protein SMG9 n=1 Tax=Helobdella robusta TaxID=6412 RepID=T1FQK4_HELRO|nr:hypothetical protein HELRODRAFT_189016 [Helobdella robusta]ESN99168.1 hypothetical protein HELRODRAFT_189016 [Helobdella robusta]
MPSQFSVKVPIILSKSNNIKQILKRDEIRNDSEVDVLSKQISVLDRKQLNNHVTIQSKQQPVKLLNGTHVAYSNGTHVGYSNGSHAAYSNGNYAAYPQRVMSNNTASYAAPKVFTSYASNVFQYMQKTPQPVINMQFPLMNSSVKLIDESFKWVATKTDMLLDQYNYLVVGVLGTQNSGKSTFMSQLAGTVNRNDNKLMFSKQSTRTRESGVHMTLGVDMYVTPERMILLDSQPLFSASNMCDKIQLERKRMIDSIDANLDVQSIQLTTFMMSVCNVIFVVVDWFIDDKIFKLLETAELFKPRNPYDTMGKHFKPPSPHIVFVLNKCNLEDLSLRCSTEDMIENFMSQSKFNYRGLTQKSIGTGVKKKNEDSEIEKRTVNLVTLPLIGNKEDANWAVSMGTKFESLRGCRDFEEQVRRLRNKLLTSQKDLMFNKFNEKKWLFYASKAWEIIRKSPAMCEYNRLTS